MSPLRGTKIGLSKSTNKIKNDWWRITEHSGILNNLMLNDMTIDDVQKWAAPEFLEQAAKALIEGRWKTVTTEKIPATTELQTSSRRMGQAGESSHANGALPRLGSSHGVRAGPS